MVVKEYDNARLFLDDYEHVLLEQEAISQFVLYNAYQNLTTYDDRKVLFGAVFDEERPTLLFSNSLPYNMAIYLVQQEKVIAASTTLADYFVNNNIQFRGINARHDVCWNFIEEYQKLTKDTFLERSRLDIMEIRKVNDIHPVEGKQRLAVLDEAKLIADWIIQFQIDSQVSEMDYEAALNRAKASIAENKIYVYEDVEEQVVTMACTSRKLVHGMAITYVFTPQENRGKGFAAANMYYLCKELLESGHEFCTILVDKQNTLSERAYEKVGFHIVSDYFEYKLIKKEIEVV
jgi:predicted GNAT family acetyltransferase